MCVTHKFFQLLRLCDGHKCMDSTCLARFGMVTYSKQLKEFVCGAYAIKYLKFVITKATHTKPFHIFYFDR